MVIGDNDADGMIYDLKLRLSPPLAEFGTDINCVERKSSSPESIGALISLLTGLHIATILSLMVSAGEKCQHLLDAKIRNVRPHLVQADELHWFVGCQEKRMRFDAPKEWGSVWTWLALDSESKLIISHYIGQRDADSAWHFMRDLRLRTEGIFELTSDGLRAYVDAVDAHFATSIHFAQLAISTIQVF